jgi:hypothetical protein
MDNKTDTIFLHDLRVETVVGIWDWERFTSNDLTDNWNSKQICDGFGERFY